MEHTRSACQQTGKRAETKCVAVESGDNASVHCLMSSVQCPVSSQIINKKGAEKERARLQPRLRLSPHHLHQVIANPAPIYSTVVQ